MTLPAEKSTFLKHLDQFDRWQTRPDFQPLRQPARARFRELSFPTPRTEDWRFTSVAPLLQPAYELPRQAVGAEPLPLPAASAPDAIRLVFVNGLFAREHSRLQGLPAGLGVGSLAAASPAETRRFDKVFTHTAEYQDQVFTALNTSFVYDGAYVVIPDGLVVSQPIEILHVALTGDKSIVTHPRTVIVAGKHSWATVIERYEGVVRGSGERYFTNAVTEVSVADDAVVDHCKIQNESLAAFHVATTQAALGRASKFTTHYISLGGGLVRNEVRARFDAENGEATVNGLYFGGGNQHVDNFTVIDHAQPHCASHELYKGILSDKAHAVFNGKIFVRPGAQKTDAKQTNKVLLLSDDATINTKPQLEIFADDVKCTHGATVGQLDENSLFYLQSRGIGLEDARRLLTYAFANDIIGRLQSAALRAALEDWVLARPLS